LHCVRAFINIGRIAFSEGPRHASSLLLDRLTERYFERRFGLERDGQLDKAGTGPENLPYAAVPYRRFRKLLRMAELDRSQDVFVDFGAGKGRILLAAATSGFRRVIGVEVSSELASIAKRNVRARADIEIVEADASVFPIPTDAGVFFFYNPFFGTVLDRVLENIRLSIKEQPRVVSLLCVVPTIASRFEWQIRQCEWLRVKSTFEATDHRGIVFVPANELTVKPSSSCISSCPM
jgi:precorrin-6B methylase 2